MMQTARHKNKEQTKQKAANKKCCNHKQEKQNENDHE